MAVNNSGREVPIAIVVTEITKALTPILTAIFSTLETTHVLPRYKHTAPANITK